MPRPHPPEFRQRAIELARLGEQPIARIAEDLGISDSCLRGWIKQDDLNTGRRADGLTTDEREELVRLRRSERTLKLENEILKRAAAYSLRRTFSQNDLHLHRQRLRDLPVRACCRVMGVSPSGFYQRRRQPVTDSELDEAYLANTIVDIHRMSRRSYGAPRVHAELGLGMGVSCGRNRVERIMRECSVQGIHRRRKYGLTRRNHDNESSDDLVNRDFDPDRPDRLWVMDITEHPTETGKVYLAAVLDAYSRRVVGWSIADHIRAELVADALQMATWRRRPEPGQTVAHSDHGSQYTSWLFGRRLRESGLLGSMGTIGDSFDNSVAESFFGTLQLELLDEHQWQTRDQLATAIFEWIEAWYNPRRRHSYCNYLSPIDYETANVA